eukprot:TRINITY_DN28318_c0_g1_i3.p1 TRINITY_DN28318_c0_g1~~TRINITY_DN28318_c0_g1_i3.p1  ORF type:complete len:144 (+),score=9.93 TRINITY_DN28318_c0_g1_i3:181-612(+)
MVRRLETALIEEPSDYPGDFTRQGSRGSYAGMASPAAFAMRQLSSSTAVQRRISVSDLLSRKEEPTFLVSPVAAVAGDPNDSFGIGLRRLSSKAGLELVQELGDCKLSHRQVVFTLTNTFLGAGALGVPYVSFHFVPMKGTFT